MKLRTAAILLTYILLYSSCKKENPTTGNSFPWAPKLTVENNNDLVKLQLNTSVGYYKELALFPRQEYSTPEYFEVWISNSGLKEWEHYSNCRNTNESPLTIEIDKLETNKNYFFKVVAVGNKRLKSESEPVSIRTGTKNLSTDQMAQIMNSRKAHQYSPDKSFKTYQRYYSWDENHGQTSTFIQNTNNQKETLIEIHAFSPAWSPKEEIIAYLSRNTFYETDTTKERAELVSLYFPSSDTIIRLTDRYFSYELAWSHSGEWICYTLDSPDNEEFNIWKVNYKSKEKIHILSDIGGLENLAIPDDKSARNPVFSYNDENIIFSRQTKNSRYYPRNLFTAPSEGGKIEQITNSYWNEDYPVSTVDGKYISFISNRTGENKIWCFETQSKEIFLLTQNQN